MFNNTLVGNVQYQSFTLANICILNSNEWEAFRAILWADNICLRKKLLWLIHVNMIIDYYL